MKFLAFDTSTDVMSIAVTGGAAGGAEGGRVWQHTGPGGAKSSATLIPAILALLAQAGIALGDLDAIVFGRGPGSFTGLRTACAVAQGLALGARQGAGVPVLPVDTLMAVAEEARFQRAKEWAQERANEPAKAAAPVVLHVTALLDARMDEMYVQQLAFADGVWQARGDCTPVRPEQFVPEPATDWLAGNVFGVYADRLPARLAGLPCVTALPTATALLRLAPALAAAGHCVEAARALPLYVRDKVALTTEERDQLKAGKMLLLSPLPAAD